MDNRVEALYAAWPLRLYLAGIDGRLRFAGTGGARDFNPAALETAIRIDEGLNGVTATSAASYAQTIVAPESIASVFGRDLAPVIETASSRPPAFTLAGSSVTVTDSLGAARAAPLLLVSPGQINFLVPRGTAPGPAVVSVKPASQAAMDGPLLVKQAAPGLFSANSDGKGAAAAVAVRIAAGGSRTDTLAYQYDETRQRYGPAPIDLGSDGEQVVLLLFGTGIRGAAGLPEVTVGGMPAEVQYAGPQAEFEGLDQVNVLLPRGLAGRGTADIVLTAGGARSNTVTVSIR